MDNSFLTWLIGALVVGLGLLLVLGLPGGGEATAPEAAAAETASVASATTYWEPVAVVTSASSTGSASYPVGYETPAPCSSCALSTPLTTIVPAAVAQAPMRPAVGGCGMPAQPCAAPSCSMRPCTCSAPCGAGNCGAVYAPATCAVRPQINRNMPLCLDECSFIQLHSSVPQPACRSMRFEWSATRGYFLDPTASDPLYYAPTCYFPDGENVWITLTVVDGLGISYTDQVQLHVNDVR